MGVGFRLLTVALSEMLCLLRTCGLEGQWFCICGPKSWGCRRGFVEMEMGKGFGGGNNCAF